MYIMYNIYFISIQYVQNKYNIIAFVDLKIKLNIAATNFDL